MTATDDLKSALSAYLDANNARLVSIEAQIASLTPVVQPPPVEPPPVDDPPADDPPPVDTPPADDPPPVVGTVRLPTLPILSLSIADQTNVPISGAAPFAEGLVKNADDLGLVDDDGNAYPLQLVPREFHADGSLRHAMYATLKSTLAAGEGKTLRFASGVTRPAFPDFETPAPYDAAITMSMMDGTVLTGKLTDAKPHSPWGNADNAWIEGPAHTEKLYRRDLDAHLTVFFVCGVLCGRRYVSLVVENCWGTVPDPTVYQIVSGTITVDGKDVFTFANKNFFWLTRFYKKFWIDEEPKVMVKPDLANLVACGCSMNYNLASKFSEADIAAAYAHFQSKPHDILDEGEWQAYMPSTGEHGDIPLAPDFVDMWFETGDPRAWEIVKTSYDLSLSFPAHYRNEKTGQMYTLDDQPDISAVSGPHKTPSVKTSQNGLAPALTSDTAHQPDMWFALYIHTGDWHYAEEGLAWPFYSQLGTAPDYRGNDQGLVIWMQVRGQAWCHAHLAQAAAFLPADMIGKAAMVKQNKANIAYLNTRIVTDPNNPLHVMPQGRMSAPQVDPDAKPWMDDYELLAACRVFRLGYKDILPFIQWKAEYQIARALGPCDPRFPHTYRQIIGKDWAETNSLTEAKWPDLVKDVQPDQPIFLTGWYAETLRAALVEIADPVFGIERGPEALAAMDAKWAKYPPTPIEQNWDTVVSG